MIDPLEKIVDKMVKIIVTDFDEEAKTMKEQPNKEVKKEVERNEMSYEKCHDCAFVEIIDLSTIDKNGIMMQCHITGFSITVKDCIKRIGRKGEGSHDC